MSVVCLQYVCSMSTVCLQYVCSMSAVVRHDVEVTWHISPTFLPSLFIDRVFTSSLQIYDVHSNPMTQPHAVQVRAGGGSWYGRGEGRGQVLVQQRGGRGVPGTAYRGDGRIVIVVPCESRSLVLLLIALSSVHVHGKQNCRLSCT